MKLSRLLLTLLFSPAPLLFSAAPTPINDPVEGKQLAQELRSVVPAENMAMKGVLRISRSGAAEREVPIESRVQVQNDNWTVTYIAKLDGQTETLTVRHSTNAPSTYEWESNGKTLKLDGSKATNSFAGSDFSLIDLGLEFFQWPTQTLVTREMRKGRGCDVLESRPSSPNIYSRVRTWIDQESRAQGQPGLIKAEAWDANGRLTKEFEVKGMKKLEGRWQVREMEIRHKDDSTILLFEFK